MNVQKLLMVFELHDTVLRNDVVFEIKKPTTHSNYNFGGVSVWTEKKFKGTIGGVNLYIVVKFSLPDEILAYALRLWLALTGAVSCYSSINTCK